MLDLYKNIKLYRELFNMTQDDLAKRVGYSNRSAIARIENGEIDLPQSKIIAFSDALHVPVGKLMGDGDAFDDLKKLAMTLNEIGMEKLMERAEELSEMQKYRKV